MIGQLTVSRPHLRQMGVCYVQSKVHALVKKVLINGCCVFYTNLSFLILLLLPFHSLPFLFKVCGEFAPLVFFHHLLMIQLTRFILYIIIPKPSNTFNRSSKSFTHNEYYDTDNQNIVTFISRSKQHGH